MIGSLALQQRPSQPIQQNGLNMTDEGTHGL